MWLFTTQGFYSVVAHRDEPDKLLVRSRAREDIEALHRQIPDLEPFEDPDADYRWRAVVSRAEFERAVTQLVAAIDYPNFKSAVGDRHSPERSALYEEVWWKMLPLQEKPASPTDPS